MIPISSSSADHRPNGQPAFFCHVCPAARRNSDRTRWSKWFRIFLGGGTIRINQKTCRISTTRPTRRKKLGERKKTTQQKNCKSIDEEMKVFGPQFWRMHTQKTHSTALPMQNICKYNWRAHIGVLLSAHLPRRIRCAQTETGEKGRKTAPKNWAVLGYGHQN